MNKTIKLYFVLITIISTLFLSCTIVTKSTIDGTDLSDLDVFIVKYSTPIGTAPELRGIVKDAAFKAEWVPELSQEGYKFNGWYWNDIKINAGYKIQENMNLIASWTLINQAKLVTVLPKGSPETGRQKSGGAIYSTLRGQKVNPYKIGAYDVTYRLWWEIKTWAENNGYTFCHKAQEGEYSSTQGNEPSLVGEYPVTHVCFYDIIMWCNAYSEKLGLTPVYYHDGDYTKIYKTRIDADGKCSGVYVKGSVTNNKNMDLCTADGYRLPTGAEWIWAALGGDPTKPEWKYKFSGSDNADEVAVYGVSRMAVVGTKKPNSLGLYDMTGNARETLFCFKNDTPLCYRVGGSYGVDDTSYISVNSRTWGDYDNALSVYPWVTFRVAQSIF